MRIASSSLLSGCCSAVILDIIEVSHKTRCEQRFLAKCFVGRLWLAWRMLCSHHRNAQLQRFTEGFIVCDLLLHNRALGRLR